MSIVAPLKYILVGAVTLAVAIGIACGQSLEDRARWQSLIQQAVNSYRAGALSDAAEAAKQSLNLARSAFGPDDLSTLGSMHYLGKVLAQQGRFREAETLDRETLSVIRKVLGPKHPNTLTSIDQLAAVLENEGRLAEAESLFREALKLRGEVLGQKDPNTLASIDELASLLANQGRSAEAEPLFREALNLRREVLGPKDPNTLRSMKNLAVTLESIGRFREAELLVREALKIRQQILGLKNPDTLMTMDDLGFALQSQGRFREAESLFRETLDLRREVLGPKHPNTLTSLSSLAGAIESQGRYGEAEALDREALDLRRQVQGPKHPDTLTSINRLASVLKGQGRFGEAEPLLREALKLRREVLGPKHPSTLTSIQNLAGVLTSQYRFGEAEPLLRDALSLRKEVLGPKNLDTITSLEGLAGVLVGEAQFAEAESLLREALSLRQEVQGTKHPDTLGTTNTLGIVLQRQGRYGEAERLFRDTLNLNREILGLKHINTSRVEQNLARVLVDEGRYADAETLYRGLLDLHRRWLGPSSPETLASMNSLAALLDRQGRFAESESLFRDTLDLRKKLLGLKHSDTLTTMGGLAVVLASEERYAEAEQLLRDTVDLRQQVLGPRNPDTLMTQFVLTLCVAAQGRAVSAVSLHRQLEPMMLDYIGTELYTQPAGARQGLVASQSSYQDWAITLAQLPGAGRDGAEMAASALLHFKLLAVEEDAYLAHLTRLSEETQIRAAANELRDLHAQMARLFQSGAASPEVSDVATRIDAKRLELGRLTGNFDPALQMRSYKLQDLQHKLPDHSALLELRLYHKVDLKTSELAAPNWAGVLITSGGDIYVRDLGSTEQTRLSVKMMLAGSPRAAAALYQQLLAPFAAELSGLQRLYVAPDDILYLVPFGLLRDIDGKLVIDRVDLRLVQTGRDLLRPPSDKSAKGLVAIGGIDFDLSTSVKSLAQDKTTQLDLRDERAARARGDTIARFRSGFSELAYSKQEVEDVADLYRRAQPSDTVVVAEAGTPTKAWLRKLLPPRVLHFATHAFYRAPMGPRDPPMLLAGIALAGANQALKAGSDGGILYALEALDLNLEGTELVVLSACETAEGYIDYGEGVSGLVRAFRTAGARNVLVTVRPVSDRDTQLFLERFYTYWLGDARGDAAMALRQTQRDYLVEQRTEPASGHTPQTSTAPAKVAVDAGLSVEGPADRDLKERGGEPLASKSPTVTDLTWSSFVVIGD
jgi:CHAT domain-containing protein/tetratricopeptide (TPR) repeat protein